ncbi:MAG: response regulator transcription factor [Aminipila sp.]
MKTKILVADDEKEILEILGILLTGAGYEVVMATNGEEALSLADNTIDLFILDVNMPYKSGFAVGVEIRKSFLAPMIFLTAFSQDSDKTMGYYSGADDYITKPFSNSELLLKVKALLRRYQQYQPELTKKLASEQISSSSTISLGSLIIDKNTETVTLNENIINLTHTEYKILELLCSNRKKIFSMENIYCSIWQDEVVSDSAVMVHIKNLRKKIESDPREPKYLKTAWGKGYYVD